MRAFTALYVALENEKRPAARLRALERYYRNASGADAAWATYLLRGGALPRTANAAMLRSAALAATGLPEWLFRMAHEVVGDVAETVAGVLADGAPAAAPSLATCIEGWLAPLPGVDAATRERRLTHALTALPREERYVFAKLAEGRLRRVATPAAVIEALARVTGRPAASLAQQLQDPWRPSPSFWQELADAPGPAHRPLPFRPIAPLVGTLEALGEPNAWQAEWQFPGVRAQLVVRPGAVGLWTEDGELITDSHPGILAAAQRLPEHTVLDGIVVRADAGARGTATRDAGSTSAGFIVHDMLELDGEDLRGAALERRRARLMNAVLGSTVLQPAELVPLETWGDVLAARGETRKRGAAGLLLRRRRDGYELASDGVPWWLATAEPQRIRGLLLYVQVAPGATGDLVLECTFAAPAADGPLVIGRVATTPLAATDVHALDRWARAHTLEKFGPVRRVDPVQVFELALDEIRPSRRHKSGVALRGLRVTAWLRDADPATATPLHALHALSHSGAG